MTDIRTLHEPLSKTGSSAYAALCTVVQAFPLAAIFAVLSKQTLYESTVEALTNGTWARINWEVGIKLPLVVAVVAVVWHRYVLDNNFMSWRMTWADAAIPFAISFVQVFFALAIPESATVFIFWFACVTGIGCLSYWHAVTNIRSKHSQALFAEHFGFEGDKIHKRIEKYFGDCLRTLIGCTLCAGVIYILCATGFLARAPNLDLAVVTIFIAIVIVMHFADDSSVRMKDYYNDWAREPK